MNFVSEIVRSLSSSIIYVVSTFMPKFMAGLIILIIGIIIASLLRDLIKIIFRYIKLGEWLEAAGLVKTKEIQTWPNLLAELTRWSIIFLAVIIGWIGLVAGRFVADIVRHGIDGVGGREALILGNIAKAAIYFFTSLIILTQLGVAAELVKILFTGIVSILALSFGLAFGLGGQIEARDLLKRLRLKIEKQSLENSKSFRSKN